MYSKVSYHVNRCTPLRLLDAWAFAQVPVELSAPSVKVVPTASETPFSGTGARLWNIRWPPRTSLVPELDSEGTAAISSLEAIFARRGFEQVMISRPVFLEQLEMPL